VNTTVDIMRSLDRQVSNLERKIESTRSEELKKDYRKTQGGIAPTWKGWSAMREWPFRSCTAPSAK
jgi:hypothetical protein